MTLEVLEMRIKEARAGAVKYVIRCEQLVAKGDLAAALEFCKDVSIDAPQFSLTAKSENAERPRNAAGRKLSDPAWWRKALETQVIRNYEGEQIAQGKVTNFASDGLAAFHAKYKTKR